MSEQQESDQRRGPYAKSSARRQEILDRAIEVFAHRGATRTSLRAIAEEVGVTHGTLTHHFGSLEALLVAVYEASEHPVSDTAASALELSPVEIMLESARRNERVPGLVQLYSTLVAAALEEGHQVAHEFATARFDRLRRDLATLVLKHQSEGRIRGDVDPDATAALVIAASDGLQAQWLLDDTAPQKVALNTLDRLLQPAVPHTNG